MPLELFSRVTWALAAAVSVVTIAGGTMAGMWLTTRRNAGVARVRSALRAENIELSPALFRAGCGPVSLVVDGGRVVVVDEASARVVRGYSRDDIRGLKVYDTYEDRISFRLLLAGDAESRLIVSRDPGETIPLFQWMQQASKPVIYVA